jgi:hypothetical protein
VTKTTIIKLTRLTSMLLTHGVLILPGISMAQQYYDPGLLHKTIDRKPADFQPPGVHLGGFVLQPGVELAYENNDNIFYLESDEISDSIIHVRPWANLNSDWSRHELNLSFYADIGRYDDFSSEDYEDWITSLNGHIEVKRDSNFNYTASYMQLHEDRSSPDDAGGINPTEFTYSGFNVGYGHTFNRLTAALNYDLADTDYSDNINGDGDILDNQDRDRSRNALMLRLDYELPGQNGIFFSATGNNVEYDQNINSSGFERSSSGYNFQGGMSWNMTGVLVGDLFLEYIKQEYDDPRFADVDGFGIGASLDWTPTELTNINILVRNGLQETTQGDTSGYFSTLYSARLQHELRRNWLLNARFSYTDNDYEVNGGSAGSLTDTQVIRAGAGVSYLFNRNFYVSAGYVYEKQNANATVFEYRTNRWFVTFGAEL